MNRRDAAVWLMYALAAGFTAAATTRWLLEVTR